MLKRFSSFRHSLVFGKLILVLLLLIVLLLDRAGAETGVGRNGMALAAAEATPTAQGFVGPTPTAPSFERPNLHIYLLDGQNRPIVGVQANLYVFRLQKGSSYGKDAIFEFVRLTSGKTEAAGRISFDVSSLLYSDSYYLELREADGVLIKPRDPDAPYFMPTGQASAVAQMDDMQLLDLSAGSVVYVNQYTIKPLIDPPSGVGLPRRASDYNLAKYWIYYPPASSGLSVPYTPTPSSSSSGAGGGSRTPGSTQVSNQSGGGTVVATYQPNSTPSSPTASVTVSVPAGDAAATATVVARRADVNSTALALTAQVEATQIQNQRNTPVPTPTNECRACVPPATATYWAQLTQGSGGGGNSSVTPSNAGGNGSATLSSGGSSTQTASSSQNGITSQGTGVGTSTSSGSGSFFPISGSAGTVSGQNPVTSSGQNLGEAPSAGGTRTLSPIEGSATAVSNQAGAGSVKSGSSSVSASGTSVSGTGSSVGTGAGINNSGSSTEPTANSNSNSKEDNSFILWIILILVLIGMAVALFFWGRRARTGSQK